MDRILLGYMQHILGTENVLENEPLSRHTSFRIGGMLQFYLRRDPHYDAVMYH